jgi:hypothetical protein
MTVVQLVGQADGLNESGTYQWFPEDVADGEDEDEDGCGSRHKQRRTCTFERSRQ